MRKLALVMGLSMPFLFSACTQTTTTTIGHAYFVSSANSSLYDYSIQQKTTTTTAIGSSSTDSSSSSTTDSSNTTRDENTLNLLAILALPASGSGFALATDLAGKYLLLANKTTGALSTYTINSSGALSTTPTATLNSTSGASPVALSVNSTGQYLYVANATTNNNSIAQYSIDSTGTLALSTTLTLSNTSLNALVASPTQPNIYLITGNALISTYTIGSSDGALTLAATSASAASAEGAYSIAISPDGLYAYVAATSGIHQYSIASDGGLTEVGTPAPLSTGTAPYTIAVDPTNKYVYVTSTSSTNIATYLIGTSGALSYQSANAGPANDVSSIAVNNRTDPQSAS